jgi:hypothetical protein
MTGLVYMGIFAALWGLCVLLLLVIARKGEREDVAGDDDDDDTNPVLRVQPPEAVTLSGATVCSRCGRIIDQGEERIVEKETGEQRHFWCPEDRR